MNFVCGLKHLWVLLCSTFTEHSTWASKGEFLSSIKMFTIGYITACVPMHIEHTHSWPLNDTGVRGTIPVPTRCSWKSMYHSWPSKNLTANYLLLTGSLTDSRNHRLTRILYTICITHCILIIKEAREKSVNETIGESTWTVLYVWIP